MNAPLHLLKEMEQDVPYKSAAQHDKKRYLWLISPFLPVLGMGILAGYQFAPKPVKKVFALGGPLLLHVIIPTIDTLIGQDANNPSNEDVKRLEEDRYYSRLVKSFIPLQYAANIY